MRLGRANASLAEDLARARKRAERLSSRAGPAAGCGYAASSLPWSSEAACSPRVAPGVGCKCTRAAAVCGGAPGDAAERKAGGVPSADPSVESGSRGARAGNPGRDPAAHARIARSVAERGTGGAAAGNDLGVNPAAHAGSARGGGGTRQGRARDMTLGQLHELIEDVFASKSRADQRCASRQDDTPLRVASPGREYSTRAGFLQPTPASASNPRVDAFISAVVVFCDLQHKPIQHISTPVYSFTAFGRNSSPALTRAGQRARDNGGAPARLPVG